MTARSLNVLGLELGLVNELGRKRVVGWSFLPTDRMIGRRCATNGAMVVVVQVKVMVIDIVNRGQR